MPHQTSPEVASENELGNAPVVMAGEVILSVCLMSGQMYKFILLDYVWQVSFMYVHCYYCCYF